MDTSSPSQQQETYSGNEEMRKLKFAYVEYYRSLPIHKLASKHIGKDPDTTRAWREEDPLFSAQIGKAKTEWARENTRLAKPEWLLERVLREEFKPPNQTVDHNIINPQDEINRIMMIIESEAKEVTDKVADTLIKQTPPNEPQTVQTGS